MNREASFARYDFRDTIHEARTTALAGIIQEVVTKPPRRHARLARGDAKKGGILEHDVDRLSGEPASLAGENQRPGLSQRRGDGWSRSLHE